MSEFKNVTIEKSANVYFDGNVTSRTVLFEDGTRKTLGIMMPGDYEFDSSVKELMEITAGDLDVKLPGSEDWQNFTAGDTFEVEANEIFYLKVKTLTDYCCSYL